MIKSDDITVVIQGPLHELSLSNVLNYKKIAKNIVLSAWDTCDPSLIHKDDIRNLDILFVTSDSKNNHFYNDSNIGLQATTTLNGLRQVKTKYAIKVRSDEIYSDISYFAKITKRDKEKLTTNNVLFQPDSTEKFHPSDHAIGGTTPNMLGTFDRLKNYCKKYATRKTPLTGKEIGVKSLGGLSPEALICLCFLQHKGVKIDINKSKKIMLENFNMVKVSEMGRYLLSIKGERFLQAPEKGREVMIPGFGYMDENKQNWVCPMNSLKEL